MWYVAGCNAFNAMDPFLAPRTKKTAIVKKVGKSKNGKPWAMAVLYVQGHQAKCWLNALDDASGVNFIVGQTYQVTLVEDAEPQKANHIKYRAYSQTAAPAGHRKAAVKSRYRLTKKSESFIRRYAEMFNLETTGHWTIKATNHLIETVQEMELFPDLAEYPVER